MIGTTLNFVQVLSPACTAISLMYAINSIVFVVMNADDYKWNCIRALLCFVLPLVAVLTIILWTLLVTRDNFDEADFPEWARQNFPDSMY